MFGADIRQAQGAENSYSKKWKLQWEMEKSHTYGGVVVYPAPHKLNLNIIHIFYSNDLTRCLGVLSSIGLLPKVVGSSLQNGSEQGEGVLWKILQLPPKDLSTTCWGQLSLLFPWRHSS